MSDIQNVHLGFNCPIKREEMTKTQQGHFCSGCSKEVIDFTNKSQAEFQEIVNSSKQKVCGSFKKSQLSQSFLKYAAATAIASATLLGACQEKEVAPEIQEEVEIIEFETLGLVMTGIIDDTEEVVFEDPMFYAEPTGGIEQFYKTLNEELKHPKELQKSGRVYVKLQISEIGQLTDVEVLKGLDPLVDKEVVRAIKAINPQFKPAMLRDIPQASQLVIPVHFSHE